VLAQRLVARGGGLPRRCERLHHFVQAVRELGQLARAAGVGGRLELSVANAADVAKQPGDGLDDRLVQGPMLAHGEEQDRDEHRELERHAERDHPLLTTRQEVAPLDQELRENGFVDPVRVEQSLAGQHRRRFGRHVGDDPRPLLAPSFLGQAHGDHGGHDLRSRSCGHGEDLVGARERLLGAGVRLANEAKIVGQQVGAERILLLEHRREGRALRPHGHPTARGVGREPSPTGAEGQRRDDKGSGHERREKNECLAELLSERASWGKGAQAPEVSMDVELRKGPEGRSLVARRHGCVARKMARCSYWRSLKR
jgi:hypothetical protein